MGSADAGAHHISTITEASPFMTARISVRERRVGTHNHRRFKSEVQQCSIDDMAE
jgi:hypothetical protein